MGGVHQISIPPSMYPEIRELLSECSETVEEVSVSPVARDEGVLCKFRCVCSGGGAVTVLVFRIPPSDEVEALVEPDCECFFRGARTTSRLYDQIVGRLRRDAAVHSKKE